MPTFDATGDDQRRIPLVYVVADEPQADYAGPIRGLCAATRSRVPYQFWNTKARGRVDATSCLAVFAGRNGGADVGVMLCGSAGFVAALTRRFRAAGVYRAAIIGEGFSVRSIERPFEWRNNAKLSFRPAQ